MLQCVAAVCGSVPNGKIQYVDKCVRCIVGASVGVVVVVGVRGGCGGGGVGGGGVALCKKGSM